MFLACLHLGHFDELITAPTQSQPGGGNALGAADARVSTSTQADPGFRKLLEYDTTDAS